MKDQNENSDQNSSPFEYNKITDSQDQKRKKDDYSSKSQAKWINNEGEEVQNVFGFNSNAELVNGRAAMFGFIMMIISELVFHGEAVTKRIFGVG
tara:strand:+ start:500 stop:784 length:285 start_codon:yes stop_codon:yes gene_type:complete